MKTPTLCRTTMAGSLLLLVAATVAAQPAQIPHHREPYQLDSGMHAAPELAAGPLSAFRQVVRVPGAPWLQLHFSEYNLGQQSFVTITSLADSHTQRLDATTLAQWYGSTAYFNGDAVEVELHVAPGEKETFLRILEVTAGEWVKDSGQPRELGIESICGTTDDRVGSTDPRIGRIVPVGCTGWLVANGSHLTAGHCTGAAMQTLQFNVPPSLADGTIVNPPPRDQYPINAASVVFINGGQGNDWAVFDTNPNANTRLRAIQVQGAFYRMSRDIVNPTTIRITGYGVDGPPPNFGAPPPRNADSQTEQTHAGASLGETVVGPNNVFWRYQADTQGGNSGGPIIIDGTMMTLGIHTHGGCTPTAGSNAGTGFENDGLENAIQTFPGPVVRYVDRSHPSVIIDGTVFRPFNIFVQGVNAVPTGGIVSTVTGSYNETTTINRAMTLTAPVGRVTIGAP